MPVTGSDDASLVRGLVERRPAALAEMFDRFGPSVHATLTRALGSSHDVDDLAQETFITVARRVSSLRDPTALRSFVVSVAIRLARNELRKRALRRWVGLADAHDVPVVPAHDAELAESVRRVYAVLDRLDAETRLAFVLRHVEVHDLVETAAACGCSLATIKRRLSRADALFERMSRSDPVLEAFLDPARTR